MSPHLFQGTLSSARLRWTVAEEGEKGLLILNAQEKRTCFVIWQAACVYSQTTLLCMSHVNECLLVFMVMILLPAVVLLGCSCASPHSLNTPDFIEGWPTKTSVFFPILFTMHKVYIDFHGTLAIRYGFIYKGLWKLQEAYFVSLQKSRINIHMTNPEIGTLEELFEPISDSIKNPWTLIWVALTF